jgi:hypothetical protein
MVALHYLLIGFGGRSSSAGAILLFIDLASLSWIAQGHTFRLGFYRLPNILTEGVFWWWFVGRCWASYC